MVANIHNPGIERQEDRALKDSLSHTTRKPCLKGGRGGERGWDEEGEEKEKEESGAAKISVKWSR